MEFYRKCSVCGKIYCYTSEDLKENQSNQISAALSGIGTIANVIGGTRYDAYELNKMGDASLNKIVNYEKCTSCGSVDTYLVSKKFAVFHNKKNGNYEVEELLSEAKKYFEKKDYLEALGFANVVLSEEEDNYEAYLIGLLSECEVDDIKDINSEQHELLDDIYYEGLVKNAPKDIKDKIVKKYEEIKKEKIEAIRDAVKKLENSSEDEDGLDIVIDIIIARIKRYELEDADKLEKILTAKKKKISAKKSNAQTKKSLLQLLAILIIFASITPIGVETTTPILNVLLFIILAVGGITLLIVASRKKK